MQKIWQNWARILVISWMSFAFILAHTAPAFAQNCPDLSFQRTSTIPSGEPRSVRTGDFNGDNIPDLVFNGYREFQVALGQGNGSFQTLPIVALENEQRTYDIAVLDVDRNNLSDVVVAANGSVRTYLATGNGNFSSPISTAFDDATDTINDVAVADLNNDSQADIFVNNLTKSAVRILYGNAQGSFQLDPRMDAQSPQFDDRFTKRFIASSTIPGIAIGQSRGAPLIGFAEQGGLGSGGAIHVRSLNAFGEGEFDLAMQHVPFRLVGVDLNADGKSEWVVNELGDGFLTTVSSEGAVLSSVEGAPRLWDMAEGDFNLDGKTDVVLVENAPGGNYAYASASIVLGDGNRGLGNRRRIDYYPTPPPNSLSYVTGRGVAVADFNRDGAPDVVYVRKQDDNATQVILLTNNCVPPKPDIQAQGLEVVQIISDLQGTVPLVAKKRTFVRLYATANFAAQSITARLYGFDGAGNSLGNPLIPINLRGRLPLSASFNRQLLNGGYLFELPAPWIGAGSLKLRGVVNEPSSFRVAEGDRANNQVEKTVTFESVPPLPVTFHVVTWQTCATPATPTSPASGCKDVTVKEPDRAIAEGIWSLKRKFPMASLDFTRQDVKFNFDDEGSFFPDIRGIAPVLNRLVRPFVDKEGKRLHYFFVGFLSFDGVDGGGGVAFWRFADAGRSAVGGTPALPHEFGHLLGLDHVLAQKDENGEDCLIPANPRSYPYPEGRIGGLEGDLERFVGFDAGSSLGEGFRKKTVPMDVKVSGTRDEMSYCSEKWFSDNSLKTIRLSASGLGQKGIQKAEPPKLNRQKANKNESMDLLSIDAVIDFRTLEVKGLRTLRTSEGTVIQAEGNGYRLVLLNAQGQELLNQPFNFLPIDDAPDTGYISLVVPFSQGATTIRLLKDDRPQPIAERTISAKAPRVRNLTATTLNNETVRLEWKGRDPDKDNLTYTIQFSPDNGNRWIPVAIDQLATRYDLAIATIPGTNQQNTGIFQVIASDGVNTGNGVSAPLAIANKPPALYLASPVSDNTYMLGQEIALQGLVWDIDQATLTGESIRWSSDRDGDIGSGDLIHFVPRTLGEHRITAQITDNEGLSATEERLIRVVNPEEEQEPFPN
jgi:hypothetical protein